MLTCFVGNARMSRYAFSVFITGPEGCAYVASTAGSADQLLVEHLGRKTLQSSARCSTRCGAPEPPSIASPCYAVVQNIPMLVCKGVAATACSLDVNNAATGEDYPNTFRTLGTRRGTEVGTSHSIYVRDACERQDGSIPHGASTW